jgi:hypothetical protein
MKNNRGQHPKVRHAPKQSAPAESPTRKRTQRTVPPLETASPRDAAKRKSEANAQELSSKFAKKKSVRTRVVEWFSHHGVRHFLSPVIAGAVATGFFFALDAMNLMAGPSRAEAFIGSSMKHVHAYLLILGFFLLALCCAMVGAPLARVLRRWLVLPLVQLGHHVYLVGAGAVLVTLAVLTAQSGADPKALAAVATVLLLLVMGGPEMQAAEYVCGLTDEQITEHAPMPIVVIGSVAVAVFLLVLLVKQIGTGH